MRMAIRLVLLVATVFVITHYVEARGNSGALPTYETCPADRATAAAIAVSR